MQWLRDYGAFVAATVAALAAFSNGWIQAKRERLAKHEAWQRELRLPRYLSFLGAADDYDTSIFMQYGEWDPHDMGPPPTPVPLPEAERAFRQALAEVVLVGPPDVALAARHVQFSLWRFTSDLDSNPWANTPRYRKRALDAFFARAADALGMTFAADDGVYGFRQWITAERDRERADEEAKEKAEEALDA
jgi:hypothetical protein